MLLSNTLIELSQRVSDLLAAALNGTIFSGEAFIDDFLEVVTYSQVSSVVKHCEKLEKHIIASLLANYAVSGPKRNYKQN